MADEAVEILLVEDNPDDAELVLHAFKRERITNSVRVIEDGEEALEYVFSTGRHAGRAGDAQPKVIFLDLKLPLVDGFTVLERIKSDPRTRRIPVVLMTSSGVERDLVRGYDLGANSYVVKPVDFEQFTQTVKECRMYWLAVNSTPQ